MSHNVCKSHNCTAFILPARHLPYIIDGYRAEYVLTTVRKRYCYTRNFKRIFCSVMTCFFKLRLQIKLVLRRNKNLYDFLLAIWRKKLCSFMLSFYMFCYVIAQSQWKCISLFDIGYHKCLLSTWMLIFKVFPPLWNLWNGISLQNSNLYLVLILNFDH